MAELNIVGADLSETRAALVHYRGEGPPVNLPKDPALWQSMLDVQFIGSDKKSHVDRGARLLWYRQVYRDYFMRQHSAIAHNVVMFEGYAFSQANRAHQIGELGAIARLAALEAGWQVIVAGPSVVKSFAAGKGNAPKEVMLREVFRRWGYEAQDNNDCDAFAIMQLCALWAHNEYPQTEEERLEASYNVLITKATGALFKKLEVWRGC